MKQKTNSTKLPSSAKRKEGWPQAGVVGWSVLLLLLLLLTACRSKKELIEHSNRERDSTSVRIEKVIDTVFKDRVIEKTKPVYFETVIEAPCDESGKLNPVNTSFGSGGNKFSITSKDGQLHISQQFDSLQNVYEKEYRSQWKQDSTALRDSFKSEFSSQKKVVVYVYPWWWWLLVILGSALGLLWITEKFNLVSSFRKLIFKI